MTELNNFLNDIYQNKFNFFCHVINEKKCKSILLNFQKINQRNFEIFCIIVLYVNPYMYCTILVLI